MKNIKKILFIISCISACISLFFIMDTYAKYVKSVSGTANISIAHWNIMINNLTVKNHTDLSEVITPVFPGNEHIQEGILAPTAEGYFDLNLNYEQADVSFDYEITVSPNENSIVKDLIVTGYSIDNNDKFDFTDGKMTDTVLNSDTTKTRLVRIYIKWDDENGAMTDENDTIATIPENSKALLDVHLSFTQKAN